MRQSMSVNTENFELIFENLNQKVMTKLRVGTLARVISVDYSLKTISVQPIVEEKINANNDKGYKYIKLPVIRNVPYIAGQKPKVDDYVVCLHLDRTKSGIDLLHDTSSFIESNTNRHDINDCVAIVIQTKDEWEFIGRFTENKSNIEIPEYEEIKAILVYSDTQIGSQIFDLSIAGNCLIASAQDTQRKAVISHVNDKLNITDLTVDCILYLYGR